MSLKLSVWSPRPNAQAIDIVNSDIVLLGLPVIETTLISLTPCDKAFLEAADTLLFVSQQAVKHLSQQCSVNTIAGKQLIAIGQGTAGALLKLGLAVTFTAKSPFNSEALLADIAFQRLLMQQIAIVCGRGGRQLLTQQLTKQGKKVERITCYRRDKCHLSAQVMVKFIENHAINAIILTSCDVVDAVSTSLQRSGLLSFLQVPVFALSQRIAWHAEAVGFTQVIVAHQASRESLYQSITTWLEEQSILSMRQEIIEG